MGLGRFGWLRAALIGFGGIWLDLAGSGCRFVWISKLIFIGYGMLCMVSMVSMHKSINVWMIGYTRI